MHKTIEDYTIDKNATGYISSAIVCCVDVNGLNGFVLKQTQMEWPFFRQYPLLTKMIGWKEIASASRLNFIFFVESQDISQ